MSPPIIVATPSPKLEQSLMHFLLNQGVLHCTAERSLAALVCASRGDGPVVLLDAEVLAEQSPQENRRQLERLSGALRFLVVGNRPLAAGPALELIQLGVSGYLRLPKEMRHVMKAIEAVRRDEFWFERGVLVSAIQSLSEDDVNEGLSSASAPASELEANCFLTPREKAVAQLVAQGLRNRDIAERLCISEKTVKIHMSRIYEKLGVSNRVQLSLMHFQPRAMGPVAD